ncbi:MAG: methylated-DNA--[protein]-cysteine S-methyltransferase [Pseudomonadota bacterium]
MTCFAVFPTAIGPCGLAWRGEVIVAANLPEATRQDTLHAIAKRSGGREGAPPPAISAAIAAITALLGGEPRDLLDLPCAFDGISPFDRQVYDATRAIAPGQTRTYGDVARDLGDVAWSRRVGQTLGRNPLPIIVPCHRVLGSGGRLTGFSAPGGVDLKLRMLSIERADHSAGEGLFDALPFARKPS